MRSPQRPGGPRSRAPNAQRARFMGGHARSLLRWLRHRSRRVSSSYFPLTTNDNTITSGKPHAYSLPHQCHGEEVDEEEDKEEEVAEPASEGYIVLDCGTTGMRAPVRTEPPRMDLSKKNWYCLSKALAKLEAFNYAKRSRLDVVTACPSLVIGPLLQSTLNASNSVIVNCLKGDREVKMKLRNFVDVRDVTDALLLVYETPKAFRRYICNSHPRQVSGVIYLLKSWYPIYKYADRTYCRFIQVSDEPVFSSKKLETLGWKFKPFEETLRDNVESYRVKGVLD